MYTKGVHIYKLGTIKKKMIVDDPRMIDQAPHGNTIIWRYMTFQKFIDLLFNSHIFFCNLNKLTDKYEGTVYDTNRRLAIKHAKDQGNNDFFDIEREQREVESLKSLTLVNCWTMRRHESYALWKIYGGSEPGVAIKTTVANLKRSVNQMSQEFDEDIILAKIKYQDRLDDSFSRLEATITKREFYDFENEMRMIIFNYSLSEGGYQVPYDISVGRTVKVDLNHLIGSIYISPFINESYHKNIRTIIQKFRPELEKLIQGSQILDQ